jgi:hypothetical protein
LTANKSLDREVQRTSALLRLEKNFLKTTSELRRYGRPNALLVEIKIQPDTVSYSDSDMDRGADLFLFDGNPDVVLLSPHLGVYELYRNPVKADAEVQSAF